MTFHRAHLRSGLPTLAALASLGLGFGPAAAQTLGALELQRHRPVTPVGRGLELEGTRPLAHLKLAAALDLNLAADVLKVTALANATRVSAMALESALAADLVMGVGLLERFEVALAVPVALRQEGDTPLGAPSAAGAGLGDLRLTVKARLLDPGADGLSLAASLTGTTPLGQEGVYLNERGPTVEPRLIAAFKRRSLQVGARVGVRLREETSLLGTPVSHQFGFAAGVDKRFGRSFHALTEVNGTTALGDPFERRLSPVEWLAGARYHRGAFSFGAGAGLGLVSGFGAPAWRALFTVAWSNDPPDADRDGVPDSSDACPDDPEDRDGFEDTDGCHEPDNDRDGILDAVDQCPAEPEDLDDFEDEDGCPDLDHDQDGVPDAADKCSSEPETVNGFEDADGCPDEVPDADKDGDGVRDQDDACPEEPEDLDGFEDADGCPDPDNDKDGLLDVEDKCPAAAETINGRDDDDGCPDEGAPQVRIGEKELEVLRPVFFKTNRFRIRHRFWNILNQIALTLKAHPEIGRCAVEGHADATGPAHWNKRLSVMRAESVIDYLVRRGVDAARLSALGHGDQKPWADNETEEGRARNRRVVFHIEGVYSSRPPAESVKVRERATGGQARGEDAGEAGAGASSKAAEAVVRSEGEARTTPSSRTSTSRPSREPSGETVDGSGPSEGEPEALPPETPTATPQGNPLKARTLREAVQLPSTTVPQP